MKSLKELFVEIITPEEFDALLSTGNFTFYWGIAPTGPIHIGYFVPVGRFIALQRAGGRGKVLIADYHAYLDDRKTPWEEMEVRAGYYLEVLRALFEAFSNKQPEFILGSEFQKSPSYIEDVLKASAFVTVKRAKRAASEVVRMSGSVKLSSLIYPVMQIVDVKALSVDLALGGIDQRHIYALAREILPKIGYKKGVYVFTPLITSLKGPGSKMSASRPETNISVHDTPEEIRKKIFAAYCPERAIEGNPVVDIVREIIFPFFGTFTVQEGTFEDYRSFEEAWKTGRIPAKDLKEAVSEKLQQLTGVIQKKLNPQIIEAAVESFRKQGYRI